MHTAAVAAWPMLGSFVWHIIDEEVGRQLMLPLNFCKLRYGQVYYLKYQQTLLSRQRTSGKPKYLMMNWWTIRLRTCARQGTCRIFPRQRLANRLVPLSHITLSGWRWSGVSHLSACAWNTGPVWLLSSRHTRMLLMLWVALWEQLVTRCWRMASGQGRSGSNRTHGSTNNFSGLPHPESFLTIRRLTQHVIKDM